MARRVIRTEYVDDTPAVQRTEAVDERPVRRTEVVEDAPVRRRRTYIEDDGGPYVRRAAPMMGMPLGVVVGLVIVAVLLLMLLLGHV